MSVEKTEVLVIGGGQAGLAVSEHLGNAGIEHLVLEKDRIAERWRSHRWDSLVANGPAWHDRFPTLEFEDYEPGDFVPKEKVADYFVKFAEHINSPIRCGVEVKQVTKNEGGPGFVAETSDGVIEARYVVSATGPFQQPVIPAVVPDDAGVEQMHSTGYRNPDQLPEGAVLVIGAGSSGVQIATELMRAGKKVYLSVGPHDRPPRSYRGRDFVWWLGVLGLWDMATPEQGKEHVTIAVSGAYGGYTIDFKQLAADGMTLVGRTESYENGKMVFGDDLAQNVADGDANYLSVLDQADAYIERNGLDLPEEPEAREMLGAPDCVTNPLSDLDLKEAGVGSIIWATGFKTDFSWLKVNALDENGNPNHQRGVSSEPGVYFVGLPWLSRRGSTFIWGVWHDAKYLADHIATQQGYLKHHKAHPPETKAAAE
ncbi:flavin-containing monooxygenase [Curvivirga sp.]|uniref:flavin-containing monooxygenase n=1 Tax=Curvivirga sp. TaxID=2856848 RepID=UPI003B5B472C